MSQSVGVGGGRQIALLLVSCHLMYGHNSFYRFMYHYFLLLSDCFPHAAHFVLAQHRMGRIDTGTGTGTSTGTEKDRSMWLGELAKTIFSRAEWSAIWRPSFMAHVVVVVIVAVVGGGWWWSQPSRVCCCKLQVSLLS